MDRDKISKTIAGILKMLVKATQQDRIDFDEDLAHEQIISLLAPVIENAERWDAYQTDLINEKAHTERFIKLMDAEEGELRRKAEKWRKVKEIAKRNWIDSPCEGCPVIDVCDVSNSLCGQADSVVEALKEPT